MAGAENPRPGGQFNTWHGCIAEDLREFRATERLTELAPLVFGVETALWSTAAKKAGKRYRGMLEAAERFMVKWHKGEAEMSRKRRASAVGGVQGNEGGGGNRSSGSKPDQGNAGRKGNSGEGTELEQ